MKLEGAQCDVCTLRDAPVCPQTGPPDPVLMVVGEAPGAEEVRAGVPFIGPSGQLLRSCIKHAGLDPEKDVAYTNVVMCRPPGNRTPTEDEILCCETRLERELRGYKGQTVLGLGRTAQKALHLPYQFKWVGDRIATFHPAYILRNPDSFQYMYNTIRKAIQFPFQQPIDPEVVVIEDEDHYEAVIEDLLLGPEQDLIWDLETSQRWFNLNKILCMAFTTKADKAWVVPDSVLHSPRGPELTQQFFDDWTLQKERHGGHNIKFDMNFVAYHLGVEWRMDNTPWIDTMLAHYCLKETTGGHGLKELASYYFDAPDYEGPMVQRYLKNREDSYAKVPRESLYKYAVLDVCYNLKLWQQFEEELLQVELWPLYEFLMTAGWAAHTMEMRGIQIDVEHLAKVQVRLQKECDEHEEEMDYIANEALDEHEGPVPNIWAHKTLKSPPDPEKVADRLEEEFNPRSVQQVQLAMFGLLGIPSGLNEKEDKLTTNADTLHMIELIHPHPFVDELIMYRKKHKLLTSYVSTLLEKKDGEDRVHPTFRIHGPETGRLSVIDPALQTIPRPGDPDDPISSLGNYIRAAFVARQGYRLIIADYAQAELRVAAALSGDPYMLDVFRQGRDLHGETCRGMFGDDYTSEQRSETKRLVFCTLYGGTAYNFASDYAIPYEKAQFMYEELKGLWHYFFEWRGSKLDEMRERGYVETILGRRRRIPIVNNTNIKDARKIALNSPIQGSAHDLTMLSWVDLCQKGYDVLLEVHDSVLVEAPEAEADVVGRECEKVMVGYGEEYFPQVPWKVDYQVRERWGEAREG